jgi:putative redox protein
MPSQEFTFENQRGEQLAARLDLPESGTPQAYALFAHCFTCSKNLSAVGHISRALTTEGIAVLRFDFTGRGESEGSFADTNFSSNIEDLVEAAEHLAEHFEAPRLLVGHSLGGAAVLRAAARIPSVQAVATISAPFDPGHAEALFGPAVKEIESEGEAEVVLAGRRFTIKNQFLQDIQAQPMEEAIAGLDRALLVFHGPLDNIVGIDQAAQIFKTARQPKSFVTLDQADHLLSDPKDSHYVGHVLSAWAGRYLDIATPTPDANRDSHSAAATESKIAAPVEAAEGFVEAKLSGAGFRTEIRAGQHHWIADEPPSVKGGQDLGPTPYELLLAGLGACTVMTLQMYARLKEIPLESVTTRLRHNKIHAQDCAECETEKGKIDRIDRELVLVGDLTDAQRERMLQIANRCPVHRTLTSETVIHTELLDA